MESLKQESISGTVRELDHIQQFLCGCSEDQKFVSINLDLMHSEIAKICNRRFVSVHDKMRANIFVGSLLRYVWC